MRKITSLLLCFLLLSLCSVTAFAADSVNEAEPSKDVVISVTVPNDQSIIVISDGAAVSLDGVTGDKFTVDRQATPKLLIKADTGRVIKSVLLDGVDVTDKLQDGYLQLDPVYKDVTVTVTTEAAPIVPGTDSPQTGDTSNLWLWWLLLIASATALTVLFADRRRRQNKPM